MSARYFLVLIALVTRLQGAEPIQVREEPGVFLGSTSCSSSSCHGGAGEKRSQYITWSRQDFHTRAYPILLNARSARIAESLNLGDAWSSARCTVCHAPIQAVAPNKLSATARPEEGVSCETCHGAAGGWLRGHTRTDWTYAMRVNAGMRDMRNLYGRANACVACHQNVDKDILEAGHPTLVFELDQQSINQPKHWRDEGSWSGARAWLTGQAVALREAAWRSRTDSDPAPDMQETAVALAWLLAKVTLTEPMLPKVVEPDTSDIAPLQKQADDLARAAPNWNPSIDSVTTLLRLLAETDREFIDGKNRSLDDDFYRARRIVPALERLVAALNANRSVPLNLETELKPLRQDAALGGTLDRARFAEHLRLFRQKL